jgi:hypothetical protein
MLETAAADAGRPLVVVVSSFGAKVGCPVATFLEFFRLFRPLSHFARYLALTLSNSLL